MRAPDIEIRRVEIDDLAPVFHLGNKVFTSQQFSNLYRTWNEYEVTSQFNLEAENFLVANVDGRIVGFVIGAIIEKARSAWTYGHIVWMAVDPSYVRSNVASRLFDKLVDVMAEQGVRMLLVDTQANNEVALKFFESQGFVNPIEHVYLTLNIDDRRED